MSAYTEFEDTELMGGPTLRSTAQLDRDAQWLEASTKYSAAMQAECYKEQVSAQKKFDLGGWLMAATLAICLIGGFIIFIMYVMHAVTK